MSTIFKYFYDDPVAVINPTDVIPQMKNFPPQCVSTFSRKIIDHYAGLVGTETIATLKTAGGDIPIYRHRAAGADIAFYQSPVGAPACVACFEEIIAMGAEKFVLFGSCGALDDIPAATLIVPTAAIRDEGTSYHYLPAADEIQTNSTLVDMVMSCLDAQGYTYKKGKSWTTDAIYRETKSAVNARKDQGCIAVEMELAAMLVAACFRGVPLASFLYTADCLDNNEWVPRDLADHGQANTEKLMELAFDCAIQM